MNKRRNLADSIKSRVAGTEEVSTPEDASQKGRGGKGAKALKGSGRRGKSFVGGYFPPEVARQVKLLAVENDTTVQSLTGEALNHLFASYGKPEIAPTRD